MPEPQLGPPGNRLLRWLAIGVSLLFPFFPVLGEPAIDWNQRWEIYKAYWDDPRPILQKAQEALKRHDPETDPKLWLQIYSAYIMLADSLDVVKTREFEQAWEIAFSQELHGNQIELLIMKASYIASLDSQARSSENKESAADLYEEALNIARVHQLPRDYNRVIRNYVTYLFENNKSGKALSLIEEGLTAVLADPTADTFDRMLMQNKAAISFRVAEMFDKAADILKDLAKSCDRIAARSFCAGVYYELSGFQAFYTSKPDLDKAMESLARSLKLAEEVHDTWSISAVHLQRSRILLAKKNWKEAAEQATKAAKGFQSMGYQASAADALLIATQANKNQRHFAEAISALRSLSSDLPESYIKQHIAVRRELADIHELRGEWKEALQERNRQMELEKKAQAERNRQEISRQTVELGLQIEEEKNKILQQENELQAQRIREAELQRRLRTQLAAAGLVVFLGTLLVLVWMIRKNKEIRRLHRYIAEQVLQRFLPPPIIKEILEGRSRFNEKPHARTVTILFADLVSFTAQVERLSPEELSQLLHDFFACMTEAIFEEGGTIDKFIGDAIMVVFGAPQEIDARTQAHKAVRCALQMQHVLRTLNQDWERRLGISFKIRIGIHQGLGVVGSYGSEKRSDYTVIGQTVNMASRIESSATPNQVLVSSSVIEHLEPAQYRCVRDFQLKGIERPVTLFEILEDEKSGDRLDQAS